MSRHPLLAIFVAGFLASATPGQVVLNEAMASNVDGHRDAANNTPDWIEVHNTGNATVDLEGWGLSDRAGDPFRWVFPKVELAADEYLVVFASGKDQRVYVNDYLPLVTKGNPWRYWEGSSEPSGLWRLPEFDDAGWPAGRSGFGFGDGDDQTVITSHSVYLRKLVPLTQAAIDEIDMLYLHVDYDDGFAAWLNGVEIARENLGDPGSFVPHDAFADGPHEARLYGGSLLSAFPIENYADLLRAGDNILSLQVHNESATSDDLSAIPFLTAGRATDAPIGQVHGRLRFPAVELHTNFGLSAAGETLTLTDAGGTEVDRLVTGRMYANVSVGRHPAGTPGVFHFRWDTPGAENSPGAEPGFSEPVAIAPQSGRYSGPVTVTLSHPSPSAQIHYTLDRRDPLPTDPVYTGPFTVSKGVEVVRARAYEAGLWPSFSTTRTYMQAGFVSDLPVFSLVTDPANLWDPHIGIYAKGPNASPIWPFFGANFWQPWERPVHVELFEPDGSLMLQEDGGIRIHGGASRAFAQKSLRIYAREGYGAARFDEPLAGGIGPESYKRFVLRAGGTDQGSAMIRDAIGGEIMRPFDLDVMRFRGSVILLNGQYWGIQNTRERQDQFYVEDYFGVDPDEVDILELDGRVRQGDAVHYRALLRFAREHDLADPAHYAYVQTQMEVDEFATYQIAQMFLANTDWPQNNIKYWRPRTPDGRWRWMLFDVDAGLTSGSGASHDTLSYALNANNPLLVALRDNPSFNERFVNRFADMLNTHLLPGETLPKAEWMAQQLDPEYDRYASRWGHSRRGWEKELERVRNFLRARPEHCRDHVVEEFELLGTYRLDLRVSPADAGRIVLETIEVSGDWSGVYFAGNPVPVEARAANGYVFEGWSHGGFGSGASIVIDPASDLTLTARFRKVGDAAALNEIHYRPGAGSSSEDWVEIVNHSEQPLDVSGWRFEDEGNAFVLPAGTTIAPRDFLVLAEDLASFQSAYPSVTNVVGSLGFGLSGSGERLRLRAASGALVDEVTYGDREPWPHQADGAGPSLELVLPGLDNALPASWRSSADDHGTPGAKNSVTP